jgi:hypothetical protein
VGEQAPLWVYACNHKTEGRVTLLREKSMEYLGVLVKFVSWIDLVSIPPLLPCPLLPGLHPTHTSPPTLL